MNNTKTIAAYPLQWPPAWPRQAAPARMSGRFRGAGGRSGISMMTAADRVLYELNRLGVSRDDLVISSNIPVRLDGLPRSIETPTNGDPGVAVYWNESRTQAPKCLAIDLYKTPADNLAAIAATLEALRAVERHGGAAILDRAFAGFVALPAPDQPWRVLELDTSQPTREEVDRHYRRIISRDNLGRTGDDAQLSRINVARDALYKQFGWT